MRDHSKLRVWRAACDLVVGVYELTALLPTAERYGLTSQMRRAAVSIPSNIAEGASRPSKKDFARFLGIAAGSCAELETQLYLAQRLGIAAQERVQKSRAELSAVRRMLWGLQSRLDQAPTTEDG